MFAQGKIHTGLRGHLQLMISIGAGLIVFCVGVYLLATHAATALVAVGTLEAEAMTPPSGAAVITKNGAKALQFTQNNTIAQGQVSLSSGTTSIGVTTYGDRCKNIGPNIEVSVDGTSVFSGSVGTKGWKELSATKSVASGAHTVTVKYTVTPNCTNKLYVDKIVFYKAASVTPAPTVTLSASPTSVSSGGSSTLTWSSKDATACVAGGAWSGAKSTSGSASTGVLTTNSSFTLTCTGGGGSSTASANVTMAASGSYTFNDDFDGPSGSAPSAKWKNDVGSWTPNKEREYYTPAGVNDYLDGSGHLVIQPTVSDGSRKCWYGTCSFDSARITTLGSFSQAYGTWKARIKLNPQIGLWPAFWFLGDNINTVGWPASGEIDAMENFGYNAWGASIHGSAVGNDVDFGGGYAGFNVSPTDWHEYGVKVTPDSLAFMFDGAIYATQTKAAFIAQYGANSWPFDKPFFPILNVAVGGSGTNYVLPTAPLSPMLVDYVRFTAQ